MVKLRLTKHLAVSLLLPGLLNACAGINSVNPASSTRIDQCKPGDTEVTGPAQCLQDDAACYAIASNRYCTGPRDIVCPAGSSALEAGTPCPDNSRCFQLSESLECVANTTR